jgi:lipopolysaccharide/colanic/teichoic acid biosynthesis glycosyltransferase
MDQLSIRKKGWLRKWGWHRRGVPPLLSLDQKICPIGKFHEKLIQERRRAERSRKPLLVVVVDAENLKEVDITGKLTESVSEGLHTCIRGTDICGILKPDGVIGVILTEVEPDKVDIAQKIVANKINKALAALLSEEVVRQITISFRTFPDSRVDADTFDLIFYPELTKLSVREKGGEMLKRCIDIIGSIIGLVIFFPFFATLPVIIKATSRGPILFRQQRIGENGRKFNLLKFRSMYLDNNDVIHREYVKHLIRGEVAAANLANGIYKIEGDPRVTKIGKYIRMYSLDELPQFINVLKGDMSLVGPRPPIHYEVENYSVWQRNRLMGKKPGITGLWQVTGRSSTTFDDMVRLDLRYIKRWTIALDLKILFRTPAAVLKCKGAY